MNQIINAHTCNSVRSNPATAGRLSTDNTTAIADHSPAQGGRMNVQRLLLFLAGCYLLSANASAFEPIFDAHIEYGAGSLPYSVTSADFDGDGKPDLAVANHSFNTVSILKNNGNGTFASAVNYGVGVNPYSVTSADFDGDGKPDLAVANISSNSVSILINRVCCVGLTGNVDCDLADVADISDLTALIDHLFISLASLCCSAEANIDGDLGGVVDISDLTALIDHLFISLAPTAPCQ